MVISTELPCFARVKHTSYDKRKHTCTAESYAVGMSPTARRVFQVVAAAGVPPRSVRSTLARICGISPQAIRDWQDGSTKNIRHEHLVAISKHFAVSIHWLLTGEAPPVDAPGAEDDARILQQWRRLSRDQKAMFLRMLEAAAGETDQVER